MKLNQLQQLIKESIQEYIREIDKKGDEAAVRAKMEACQEAIASRKKKIEMSESLEEMKDMVDPAKIKNLKSEIKTLEKSLNKYQKQLEKMEGKMADKAKQPEKKEVVTEEEPVSEVDLDMNEEGVTEAKKKPSAGMTQKEKSALAKKAHAGKDIGKKGPGFEKVAKTAEKQYGSKEAGQRVAAAAMWKNAAKNENQVKTAPEIDTPVKPEEKKRRRSLTPPSESPNTKPKAEGKEMDLANKMGQRFSKLSKNKLEESVVDRMKKLAGIIK